MSWQERTASVQTVSVLSTHTVLRNTYMLLSMTLLFSALMAGVAVMTHAAPMPPLMSLLGYMALLFLTSALRNSGLGIVAVFAFTGFMGYTLGPILSLFLSVYSNGSQIVMTAFGATGIIFLSLSAYVLTTKKDFTFMGGFLFIGMMTVVLMSLGAMLFNISGLHLISSAAMILIASGLILFDTSRILHNGERNYIMATIQLYLDIYMLFINLLQILGSLSGRSD